MATPPSAGDLFLVRRDRRRFPRDLTGRPGVAPPAAILVASDGARVPVVVLVDDHSLLGDVVVETLRRQGFLSAAVLPTSADAVVEQVVALGATMALVDPDLGSAVFDGLTVMGPLRDLGIDVVALTSVDDPLLSAASLEAGARMVLSKCEPFTVTLDAIKAAARGERTSDDSRRDDLLRLLREARRAHAARLAPFARLTPREREVLSCLVDGLSAADIAASSRIALPTVRSHIDAVLHKLEVPSQLAAVAAVRAAGWTGEASVPMAVFSPTLRI